MNNTEQQKTLKADEHAAKVFEERNRALRVLYDTVLQVEGASDEEVFSILCRNLKLMTQAEYVMLVSHNTETGMMSVEAEEADEPEDVESVGGRFSVTEDFLERFKQGVICKCDDNSFCLKKSHKHKFNNPNCSTDRNCYRLSLIREGELVAIGMVRLKVGAKLKMKDLIINYLNTAALIIQRMTAIKALKEAHAQNELLLTSICSILIVADEDGIINKWNSVAETTFGIKARDALGRSVAESGIYWDYDRVKGAVAECMRRAAPTRVEDVEFRYFNGETGYISVSLNPIVDESGQSRGVLLMGRDVTVRKNMEAQLLQSEKMAGIGQLAAGVAHEINNPTGFVASNISTLREYVGDIREVLAECRKIMSLCAKKEGGIAKAVGDAAALWDENGLDFILEDLDDLITDSLDGTERIRKIVSDLREFSRASEDKIEEVVLNDIIDKTLGVAGNEIKYKADLEINYGELPPVMGSVMQLEQVFMNILINATQSIEGRGAITINTYTKKNTVCVDIADTGKGIPPDVQSRIFEPFFTTKDVGEGTGLGLHITYNLIKRHNGTISVKSKVGQGTTFTIALPVAGEASDMVCETAGTLGCRTDRG